MNRSLIGYWIRDLNDEEFCAPQEVVGNLPPDVRDQVADYLDAGAVDVFRSQCGYSWCRFFCGIRWEQMGSRELTDGVWIWPQGLAHYVRSHGIILPEGFVAHALARKSPQIKGKTNAFHDFGSVKEDLWREWCAAHRSPVFLDRLRRARAEADVRAAGCVREYIDTRVSEEIACTGLGEERCIFAGCEEKVLRGMRLCARHILRDEPRIVAGACYLITEEFMAESVRDCEIIDRGEEAKDGSVRVIEAVTPEVGREERQEDKPWWKFW